jgi:hypothetical protein
MELDNSLSTAQQLYGNWKICFQLLALLGQKAKVWGVKPVSLSSEHGYEWDGFALSISPLTMYAREIAAFRSG